MLGYRPTRVRPGFPAQSLAVDPRTPDDGPMHPGLVPLAAAVAAGSMLHIGGFYAVARVVGLTVSEVSLGMGPLLLRRVVGGVTLQLRLLPFAGHVKFPTPEGVEEDPDAEPVEPPAPLRCAAVGIGGSGLLVVLSVLLLGLGRGWREFVDGFGQLVVGVVSPTRAVELCTALLDLLVEAPLHVGFGVVLAKLAAANLMPIPPLSGGEIVLHVANALRPIGDRTRTTVGCISMCVVCALAIAWIVALVRAAL